MHVRFMFLDAMAQFALDHIQRLECRKVGEKPSYGHNPVTWGLTVSDS